MHRQYSREYRIDRAFAECNDNPYMGPLSQIHQARSETSTLPETLETAAAFLNARQAFGTGNEVVVTNDERTHRQVVQLVDSETRTVVRQISPPSMFNMVRRFTR